MTGPQDLGMPAGVTRRQLDPVRVLPGPDDVPAEQGGHHAVQARFEPPRTERTEHPSHQLEPRVLRQMSQDVGVSDHPVQAP